MGSLPKPPNFLFKPQLSEEYSFIESPPDDSSNHFQLAVSQMPDLIPNNIYQTAIEQRRSAEMSYAEIYSQYLEVVAFNEKLLRSLRRFESYRKRVRKAFNNLKSTDSSYASKLLRAQSKINEIEQNYHDLLIDNESLKISNAAHEESFKAICAELENTRQDASDARTQFQLLSEEFENRGFFLSQAEEKLKEYLERIDQMSSSMENIQKSNSNLRDENLLFQSKLSEITKGSVFDQNTQITSVLTNSIFRMQKKISELEKDMKAEKAKPQPTPVENKADFSPADTLQMNPDQNFYDRWKGVLNQITSHTISINTDDKRVEKSEPEVMSEAGELL